MKLVYSKFRKTISVYPDDCKSYQGLNHLILIYLMAHDDKTVSPHVGGSTAYHSGTDNFSYGYQQAEATFKAFEFAHSVSVDVELGDDFNKAVISAAEKYDVEIIEY